VGVEREKIAEGSYLLEIEREGDIIRSLRMENGYIAVRVRCLSEKGDRFAANISFKKLKISMSTRYYVWPFPWFMRYDFLTSAIRHDGVEKTTSLILLKEIRDVIKKVETTLLEW